MLITFTCTHVFRRVGPRPADLEQDWWINKERYQEYASTKLAFHGMEHAMHRFDVPGRGLLSALRVANRLKVEELACVGV